MVSMVVPQINYGSLKIVQAGNMVSILNFLHPFVNIAKNNDENWQSYIIVCR
jgi:hypothetical protein